MAVALSNKKLSNKRAKKKANRNKRAKQQTVVQFPQNNPIIQFDTTINYVNKNWGECARAMCFIVRDTIDGDKHVTAILLDTDVTGVKDIYELFLTEDNLNDYLSTCPHKLSTVSDSYMYQLIKGAIKHTKSMGENPHKNYHKYSKYIEKLQNNPNEQYDFKYGQLATHLSDEIFKAYYYSSSGEEHCLYDSEEDNQNHLTQQEINMFNKNTPVIDIDDDNESFWDDEEASTMVAKNVFKNAIALTQLVAEKDEKIRSKKQILDTYEEAFMRIMSMLDKMK